MLNMNASKPFVQRFAAVLFVVIVAAASGVASDDDSGGTLVIGLRRDAVTSTAPAARKEWFKSGLSEAALHNEALAAARVLGTAKGAASELDDLKEGLLREKDRAV